MTGRETAAQRRAREHREAILTRIAWGLAGCAVLAGVSAWRPHAMLAVALIVTAAAAVILGVVWLLPRHARLYDYSPPPPAASRRAAAAPAKQAQASGSKAGRRKVLDLGTLNADDYTNEQIAAMLRQQGERKAPRRTP